MDACALLALLQREPGSDRVQQALPNAVMSVANLAEVLGKAADRGLDVQRQYQLVASLGIRFEPVTEEDAVTSARLRRREAGGQPVLSLGDRLCLALARRLDLPALTAHRAWEVVDHGVDVHMFR